MRLTLLLPLAVFSGCTTTGLAMRDAAVDRAAEAYDEALEVGEFTVCDAPSFASVRRRYAVTEERWEQYLDFCGFRGIELTRPE